MSNASKIIADSLPEEAQVITELIDIKEMAASIRITSKTFAEAKAENPKLTAPAYMTEIKLRLGKIAQVQLSTLYPAIKALLVNGTALDGTCQRLQDGLYTLNTLLAKLTKANCLPKSDAVIQEWRDLAAKAQADFLIFIMGQFSLYSDNDQVEFSVQQYCQKQGITESIWYGQLLTELSSTGRDYYAYEPMSPQRDALMLAVPDLVGEMEESLYPLTPNECKLLLNGTLNVNVLSGKIGEYYSTLQQREVDTTPATLMDRMSLEG